MTEDLTTENYLPRHNGEPGRAEPFTGIPAIE
jgi:hypothetical protein